MRQTVEFCEMSENIDQANIYHGNTKKDGADTKGWFLGHFLNNPNLKTTDLEVILGQSKAGDSRDDWSTNITAHFLTIMISGRQVVETSEGTFDLKPGDFLFGHPGVAHRFRTHEDCQTVTIKWPSIPNDLKRFKTLDEWREWRESLNVSGI